MDIQGNKTNIAKIKIQIENQFDPFFNLIYQCDQFKYKYVKQQCGINTDFQQFPTILIKCFNKIQEQNCCKGTDNAQTKGKMCITLQVGFDGKSKLSLSQSSSYKNIQIFHLDICQQNEQQLQKKVRYKYTEMKKKIAQGQVRLAKIQQIIKIKNPTLLTQIYKITHGQMGKFSVSGI